MHDAIDRADLIVSIGHDTVEAPFLMGPDGPQVIHFGYTADVEEVFFPHAEVVGDVEAYRSGGALEGELPNGGVGVPLREGILERTLAGGDDDRFPLTAADRCRRRCPTTGSSRSTTACTSCGSRATTARAARTRCCSTTLATMATSPSAMMASLLYPDRRVLAVCGDGGFMMNSQELETAVRLGIDLVVMILEDDAYGMIRWK